MKKIILFITAIFTGISLHATIHTVSNHPTNLAQFNTIQAAIDACAISGDIVYVHGSPISYLGFTISNKQITVIGPGWAPDKALPLTAIVGGNATVIDGAASSGTEIQGLVFSGATFHYQGNVNINNIRFIRNRFDGCRFYSNQGGGTFTGWRFEGNYFNLDVNGTGTFVNCVIQNNIFFLNDGVSASLGGFLNAVNVLIDHNLFYGPASPGTLPVFWGNSVSFLTITNNIFVNRNAAFGNSNSVFNNNITFNAGDNSPWLANGNVDSGGNISNEDPQMVAQTAVNAGTANPLLDFTIAAGPANNTGINAKDIGLLFEANSSLNWLTSRISRLPFIYSMNVANPTIPAGGTLNVTIEARKNN